MEAHFYHQKVHESLMKNNSWLKVFALLLIITALSGCASLDSLDYYTRIKAVNRTSDQSVLSKVALGDVDWRVREAAIKKLQVQGTLLEVALHDEKWNNRNLAFDRLDNNTLTQLCKISKDQAMVIAAQVRLGNKTWNEAFSNNSSNSLGDVIGAAALVNSPEPASNDVVSACHKYIRKGDASRIPELINLLNRFGDKTLAEDYMNCGNSQLNSAGVSWGRAHGYNVSTGAGSHRVQWGEDR